ncbi:ADP-ribosylglycohydrolase family protein [Candidatus Woesearchaeota archaeon]|nr:ADP-ribosylglycohydrolase family protein [Candidatus Woesearchaeota archaeon]
MNNYSASLIGCAIGDSLGMPVEGWKREQIQKYVEKIDHFIDPVLVKDKTGNLVEEDEFGKLRYWTKDFKKGEYTDDTILTLTIAESLAQRGGVNIYDIAERHLIEYKKDNKGFGGTTREAMENLIKGKTIWESGVIGGPGNAPAMKMSPMGFYMHATGNYKQGLELARLIGQITHLDPRSVAGGIVQAHAIYSALKETSREEFVNSIVEVCKEWEEPLTEKFSWHEQGNLLSRLEWIKENKDASDEEAYQHIGCTSVTYRSYPFALFMFQKHLNNPIQGLIEAVNYGGDCDTVGAMYGSLVGARFGDVFPENLKKELKNLAHLQSLGETIHAKLTKKVQ